MIIEVDFDSDEAIYIQLCNQIIMGIATSVIQEGDSLPSVRQLADRIGVNMHTVNKAYSVLKREGYISLDKRRGAVIALDIDKMEELEEKGSVMAVSDVGVAVQMARAAITGAVMNVYINTKSMKNREMARQLNRASEACVRRGTELADRIYGRIQARLLS